MKVAEDAREHVRSIYDKVKAQVDSAPRDDGTLLEKRKELQREVDVTKRTLTQQVKYRGQLFKAWLVLTILFRNVYMINKVIPGCLEIWNFSSSVQLNLS